MDYFSSSYLECPPPRSYEAEIPGVYFEDSYAIKGDRIQISIKYEEVINLDLKLCELFKLRHEVVSKIFSGSKTDVRLSSLYGLMEDEGDILTPDIVLPGDHLRILEIGTTLSGSNIKRDYLLKKNKYLNHIYKRAERTKTYTTFYVLVVADREIITNLPDPNVKLILSYLYIANRMLLELRDDESLLPHLKDVPDLFLTHREIRSELINMPKIKCLDSKYELLNIEESEDIVINLSKERLYESYQSIKIDRFSHKDSGSRTDFKKISPFPMAYGFDDFNIRSIPYGSVQSEFFRCMLLEYTEPSAHVDHKIREIKKIDEEWEQRVKTKRNNILFKSEAYSPEEFYAELGFMLDSKLRDSEAKNKKVWKRTEFSLKTDTYDIDEFISDCSLYSECEQVYPDLTDKLNEFSTSLVQNFVDHGLNSFMKFKRTKMGICLDFIGDLCSELIYSFKNITKNNTFYVRKLKRFPVFLISNSKGSNHPQWFTILGKVNAQYVSSVFNSFKPLGDLFYTEFRSITEERCAHYLNTLEIIYAVYLGISTSWKLSFRSVMSIDNPSVLRTLNLATLLHLEAKQRTSSSFVNLRYFYMEFLKGQGSFPPANPFKICSRLEDPVKSRLQVWFLKNLKRAGDQMLKVPPYHKKIRRIVSEIEEMETIENYNYKDFAEDIWFSLVSLIPGEKFIYSSQVITFCYLGYLHNKDEINQNSLHLGIYKKLIKMELVMRDFDFLSFKANNTHKGAHYYNPKFIKHIVKDFKGKYYQPNLKQLIEMRYLNELYKNNMDKMATFKSSAPRSFIRHEIDETKLKRPKLIESMLDIIDSIKLDKNKHLFSELSKIIPSTQKLKVFLFRKNQIGGVREIYILPAEFKMMIFTLEAYSRKFCETIPHEMLTKGKSKRDAMRKHRLLTAESCDLELIGSLYASGDCSVWCQNFTMPQFFTFLSELVPDWLLGVLKSILNLISNKQIFLSPEIRANFRTTNVYSSKEITELKRQYLGLSDYNDLIDPLGNFITNHTGFMQGILHFTSSLYHSAVIEYTCSKIKELIEDKHKGIKLIISKQVSSGDWGVLMSVLIKDRISLKVKHSLMKTIQLEAKLILEDIYTSAGIVISEKSTFWSLNTVYEFNSAFEINESNVCPLIPHCYSSMDPKSFSKFELASFLSQNLRASLLESGMPISLVAGVQSAQLRAHYRCLGSNSNPSFSEYSSLIQKFPAAGLGLFIKEPSLLCGVSGINYAKTLAYRNSTLFKDAQNVLNHLLGFVTFEEGFVSQPIYIHQGKQIRYRNFLNECKRVLKINLSTEDFDPMILYDRTDNIDKAEIMMSLKANSPDAFENFMKKTQSYFHRAGIYCLNNSSVVYKEKREGLSITKKGSLIAILEEFLKIGDTIEQNLIEYNPSFTIFDEVLHSVKNLTVLPLEKRLKTRLHNFQFHKLVNEPLISLLSCVRLVWFGISSQNSSRMVYDAFKQFQGLYPWLRETHDETLSLSPFEKPTELYNFITKGSLKTFRNVCVLGPVKGSIHLCDSIKNLVKYDYFHNSTLLLEKGDVQRYTNSTIALISEIYKNGFRPECLRQNISNIMRSYPNIYGTLGSRTFSPNKNVRIFGILQKYFKDEIGKDELLDNLRCFKHGEIGFYKIRQKVFKKDGKVKYHGIGNYQFWIHDNFGEIHLNSNSNGTYVEYVELNEMKNTDKIETFLRRKAESEGWNLISEDSEYQICGIPLIITPIRFIPIESEIGVAYASNSSLRVYFQGLTDDYISPILNFRIPLSVVDLSIDRDQNITLKKLLENNRGQLTVRALHSLSLGLFSNYTEEEQERLRQYREFIIPIAKRRLSYLFGNIQPKTGITDKTMELERKEKPEMSLAEFNMMFDCDNKYILECLEQFTDEPGLLADFDEFKEDVQIHEDLHAFDVVYSDTPSFKHMEALNSVGMCIRALDTIKNYFQSQTTELNGRTISQWTIIMFGLFKPEGVVAELINSLIVFPKITLNMPSYLLGEEYMF